MYLGQYHIEQVSPRDLSNEGMFLVVDRSLFVATTPYLGKPADFSDVLIRIRSNMMCDGDVVHVIEDRELVHEFKLPISITSQHSKQM